MGKSRAPTPPDPAQTAGAQTGQNIGTAIAQQYLNNVNQVTPNGSLTYDQTGSFSFTDPNTGQVYDIPRFTATQTLSPTGERLDRIGNATSINMAQLGRDQSERLQGLLGTNFSLDGMPAGGTAVQGPQLQTSFGRGGQVRGQYDAGGDIQSSFGRGGQVTGQIADAGDVTRTYGTDFSQDRRRVERALMSRMNPQLDRDREALRTSLVNQGVVEGSEAFDRAMSRADQGATDARMQAILAGGQEQSRMAGLEQNRAMFENSAQSQVYGQNANNAGFANQAQAQRFGQNQALAGFGNAAQAQGNAQNLQAAGFANAAQGQRFDQNQAAAGFGNAAAQQGFANSQATYDMQNADRQRAIQEALLLRNQPMNEISALMSGSQVQQPSFVGTNPAQIANVDRAGLDMQAYQQRLAGWQQQQAQRQSVLGGLFGLASGGLAGGFFG